MWRNPLTLLLSLPFCWACSYVEIPWEAEESQRPRYLIARTMELSNLFGKTEYSIEAVPRNGHQFGYVAPTNHFSHFQGKSFSVPFEGMNEVGLTISAHYLAQSVYETRGAPELGKPEISALELVPTVLKNCSSVEEAVRLLEQVQVVASQVASLGGLHWAIADAFGRSIIVEYLEGERRILENHPRVMTNDPDIRWHWRNLNTYVNLSPSYPYQNDLLQTKTDDVVGSVPRPIGHGWNLYGLPGDSSPPSRFVRLFYLRGYALHSHPLTTFKEAVTLGTALLNNVFLAFGAVAGNPREPGDGPELTDYAVLKSSEEKVLLIRGYVNSQWRKIDLKRLDFSQPKSWPLEDGSLGIQDITDAAQSGQLFL